MDIGCGGGSYTSKPHGTINLDIGKPNRGVPNFIQADGQCLPFKDNVFDKVYCLQVIEHTGSPLQLVKEIHRVLRAGGTMLLTTPNSWHVAKLFRTSLRGHYSTVGDHIVSFTNVTLEQLLQTVFTKVKVVFVTVKRHDEKSTHRRFYNILTKMMPLRHLRAKHLLAHAKK